MDKKVQKMNEEMVLFSELSREEKMDLFEERVRTMFFKLLAGGFLAALLVDYAQTPLSESGSTHMDVVVLSVILGVLSMLCVYSSWKDRGEIMQLVESLVYGDSE